MTDLRAAAIKFEGVKLGMSQSKDGHVFRLSVHPNDTPEDLMRHPVGARYMVALVRLDDHDQPMTPAKQEAPAERATSRNKNPEPWHTLKLSKRAAIMCGEPMFWGWAERQYRDASGGCLLSIQNAEHAADWLRWKTSVSSRKEYDTDEAAGRRYLEIERSYRAHRMEVERYGEAS